MWNLVLVHLETVLVSVQDRSTVCAKLTNRPRLDAPNGTPLVTRLKWKLISVCLGIVHLGRR
jgi:hypothetical protein